MNKCESCRFWQRYPNHVDTPLLINTWGECLGMGDDTTDSLVVLYAGDYAESPASLETRDVFGCVAWEKRDA
jgi:hypothetical protein